MLYYYRVCYRCGTKMKNDKFCPACKNKHIRIRLYYKEEPVFPIEEKPGFLSYMNLSNIFRLIKSLFY